MSSKVSAHDGRRGKLSLSTTRRRATTTKCSVISDSVPFSTETAGPSTLVTCEKNENQQVSSSASTRDTLQTNNSSSMPGHPLGSQNSSSVRDQTRFEFCVRSTEYDLTSLPELPPWYGLKEKRKEDKRSKAEIIKVGDVSLEWRPLPSHCQKCLIRSKHKRAAELKKDTSALTVQKSSKNVETLQNSKAHVQNDGISGFSILNHKTNLAEKYQTDISSPQSGKLKVNVKESCSTKNSLEIPKKHSGERTSDESLQLLSQMSSTSSSERQIQENQHSRTPSLDVIVVGMSRKNENESHRSGGTKRTLTESSADNHQNAAKKPRLTDLVTERPVAELKPKFVGCSGSQMKQPALSQKRTSQTRLDNMLVRDLTAFSSRTDAKTFQTSAGRTKKSVMPNKTSPNQPNLKPSNHTSTHKFPVQGKNTSGTLIASTNGNLLASNLKPLFKRATSEQVTRAAEETKTTGNGFYSKESQPTLRNTALQTDRHPTSGQDEPSMRQNLTIHGPGKPRVINKSSTDRNNTSSHLHTEFQTAREVGTNRTVFPQQGIQSSARNQDCADQTYHRTTFKESEMIQSCPLCPLMFPTGWTFFERDNHIAVCLSKSSDDTTW